ncbi:(d)CMP kinase [Thermogladius sp. 4427co]|uniref:(d)CMP kinase n=1 Tax=Thermogladius sp. 4427co TaxID=3450718 RepID=UPI003F78BE6E
MVRIAVSGPPGSGKTTQARKIAEEYSLVYYSAGSIFREIAKRRGVSIEELSYIALKDPSIDIEIDKKTYHLSLEDNIVLDGHLTAWIASDLVDFRIYITAPLHVRVSRIAARDNKPYEEALRETIVRESIQKKRFFEFYGIDVTDLSIFDLVIDSSNLSVEETFLVIKSSIDKFLKTRKTRIQ